MVKSNIATDFWINAMVTFLSSLFPRKAPPIAQTVAAVVSPRCSVIPAEENLEAYIPVLVRSTNAETTTPVPINASLLSPDLIRKALRNAPWLPDNPPKNPLSAPPITRLFLPTQFLEEN